MIHIDFNTTEGAQLKRSLEARLTELRFTNDRVDLDLAETNVLRGRIAEIKSLLTGGQVPVLAKHPGYGRMRPEGGIV